ncbi:MAG: hypothetical protein GY760_27205 [Deltaproteobacteria bacterium]|nr:hypothetical protein [Deltaproteobacteria bacterium]
MTEYIFKKNLIYRLSAYLLLIPFLPGIRPILNNYKVIDLAIFVAGFLLMMILIIISNRKPYLTISDNTIRIYLIHSHKPEIHRFDSVKEIVIRNNRKLTLITEGFDPLEIRLNKKELTRLISILESERFDINKADHNL